MNALLSEFHGRKSHRLLSAMQVIFRQRGLTVVFWSDAIAFAENLAEMLKRKLIGNFKRKTSVGDDSEALYYLEDAEFELEVRHEHKMFCMFTVCV